MSHPNMSVRSASASLLNYLETITPISVSISLGDVLRSEERNSLNEYREDVQNINQLLERYSWNIITLLESLDEAKKTRSLLMEKRKEVLAKSEELISASQKSIHLPYEILGLIARYVQPEPKSVEDAASLKSSSCKWDQILFAHCLIQLYDEESQSHSESLQSLLTASSQANLVVKLVMTNFTLDPLAQSLLQSRRRWATLALGGGVDGDAIREAFFMLRCPNCPPISESGHEEPKCQTHTVMQSVFNFTIHHRELHSFWGMLTKIRYLTIKVIDLDDPHFRIDYSKLVVEAPLLAELGFVWKTSAEKSSFTSPSPVAEPRKRVLLPKLWKVSFIQDGPITVREDFEMAFGLLDGSNVDLLYIHDLDGENGWTGSESEKDVIRYLGEVFPSVERLTLAVEPTGSRVPEKLFLELLAPGGHKVIFPQIRTLTLELDLCLEHVEILIPVLRRGSIQGVQEIRYMGLYTNLSKEEVARVRETDNYSRIVGGLQRVTFINF